jgi:hypothetical protein
VPGWGLAADQQPEAEAAGRVEGDAVKRIEAGHGRKGRGVALRIYAGNSKRGVEPKHKHVVWCEAAAGSGYRVPGRHGQVGFGSSSLTGVALCPSCKRRHAARGVDEI